MSQEQKARELMAQGDKKLKSWFGGQGKFEEAAELYGKAANLFKLAKKTEEAANAFQKCADCHLKVNYKYDAAMDLINAGNCLKKDNLNKSVQYTKDAVLLLAEEGRFSVAAKHQKDIAEICEKEEKFDLAIEAYTAAADFFEGENSQTSANQCWVKIAFLSAQMDQLERAIQLYEKVAEASLGNSLTKFSAKDYLFRAGLCHLAFDIIGAKRAILKYKDLDVSFETSRECKFLDQLVDAYEKLDVEAFTNAVVEFDSLTPLDAWKSSLLYKSKMKLKEDGDDEDVL